jgi:hypothetical protein
MGWDGIPGLGLVKVCILGIYLILAIGKRWFGWVGSNGLDSSWESLDRVIINELKWVPFL